MNKILWKLQQDFEYALEDAQEKAKYGDITIKELLELGFNNNYLVLSDGTQFGLGFALENGDFFKELTEEQLNTKVYMKEDFGWYSDEDIDDDGYHIAKVYCKNKENEKLFKEEQ